MKLKPLLPFLIIFVSCFGQLYKPLLDSSNQWHFTSCNSGCLTDIYYTIGDTLFNGFTNKILDGSHFNSITFLLRQDTSIKKVYLTKINSKTSISEYLLYDFSLTEGQTTTMNNPLSPFPLNGGTFILDSIRMKPLVNAINYKHFYFSPTV